MNEEELKKSLENLEFRDVINYDDTCLVVSKVNLEEGRVSGHMVYPTGVNSISIDELIKKDKLYIAEWKKLK